MAAAKKITQTKRVSEVAQLLINGLQRHFSIEEETRETTCNSGQPERSWSKTEMENK